MSSPDAPPPPNPGSSSLYYPPYSYPYQPPHSPAPYPPYPPYIPPQHNGRGRQRNKPRRGYNPSSSHYPHLPHYIHHPPSPSSYLPGPHSPYHAQPYLPQNVFIPGYTQWSPHHHPHAPLPDQPYHTPPPLAPEQLQENIDYGQAQGHHQELEQQEQPLPEDKPPSEPSTPKLSPQSPSSQAALDDTDHIKPQSELPLRFSPSSSDEFGTSEPSVHKSELGGWAIWPRRPHNPSLAPGIIISSRANPPSHIRQVALDSTSPPSSPPPTLPPAILEPTANVPTAVAQDDDFLPQEEISATSSSVTETTPTTTRPVSPASSHTSISAANSPFKTSTDPAAVPFDPAHITSSSPEGELPFTPEATPAASTPSSVVQSTDESKVAVAPPPLKKSWASLLRPSGEGSSTTSKLPTSSVVGISIPADSTPSSQSLSTSRKAALSALLDGKRSRATSASPVVGYASAAAAAPPTIVIPPTVNMHKIRPRGLVNSGNMCFANSVLQILVYCQPFHSFFAELGRLLPDNLTGIEKEKMHSIPLVRATIDFLKEFAEKTPSVHDSRPGSTSFKGKEKENGRASEMDDDDEWSTSSFLPSNIYDAMKEKKRFDSMRGGQQEDAEEFFGFYLDTLEEELSTLSNLLSPTVVDAPATTVPASQTTASEEIQPREDGWLEVGKRNRTIVTRTIKNTESAITRIFGGKFRSTLKAPGQKDSVIVEDWRSLRLDIQREQVVTIEDALAYITHTQPIQMAHPTRAGIMMDASQQVLVDSLPSTLVLHLKRFCYDVNVGGVVKVSKHVRFGPELDIGSELMAQATRRPGQIKYKLFGVLYHHGISAGGGHYTLDVLHPSRFAPGKEGWVRIDDELVSDVRREDVFEVIEKDDTRCAYLLFYRKVVPVGR